MPRRVTIVQGHPDPGGKHLCHALADDYADGAAAAGREITRIEVAQQTSRSCALKRNSSKVLCRKRWSRLKVQLCPPGSWS
jgi:putative NADPH-quinone reductase